MFISVCYTTIFSYFSFYKFKQRAVINFKSTTRKGIPTLPIYVSDIPDYVTVKSYTFWKILERTLSSRTYRQVKRTSTVLKLNRPYFLGKLSLGKFYP